MTIKCPLNAQMLSQAASPLNSLELTSINSMIAYTADSFKVSEGTVRDIFISRFNIEKVNELPKSSYDAAISFLADTKIDLLLN